MPYFAPKSASKSTFASWRSLRSEPTIIPTSPRSAQRGGVATVGLTLELLGAQIETQELISHGLDIKSVNWIV